MGRRTVTKLTVASKLPFEAKRRRRGRHMETMSSHGCCCCSWTCRCSNFLLSLILLMMLLLPVGSRAQGAAADGDTPNPRATFYDCLGVSPRTSQVEIKRMFRKLAVKMHPDKLGPFESEDEESEANAIFVKILQAYETLGDPLLRQKYDMSGMKEGTNGRPVEEEVEQTYEDAPFGIFVRFGGGRGGLWFRYKGHGTRSAPDTVIALPLTFEEAFEGKSTNVTVARERLCSTCAGTGSADPAKMPKCPLCEGKGYAYHLFGAHESNHHQHRHASSETQGGRCSSHEEDGDGAGSDIPGYAHAVNTTCKACSGTGKLSDGGCPDCRGRRVNVETETFEVTMPAGVLPGHTVTFGGKGTEHPNKKAGSVRVVAVQSPHPRFEREGADLVYKKSISLMDALLGFERMLTLLDGTRIPIVHDEIPLSGHRQELPGRGFPVEGKPEERGSLYIDFEVDFPSRLRKAHLAALRAVLTEEEIAILEDVLKLMSARKGNSRPQMGPLEYRYTWFCSVDGDSDSEYENYPRCIPDLLWWARPSEGDDDNLTGTFRP
ncbi:unnamed protein product [Pylaiella littoralis]